jgi:hypothetical protein
VTIIASYSGDPTHGASSGTSSLTVTAAHSFSIVRQSSGLVAHDPLNDASIKTGDTSRYWRYGGSAAAQNAPYSYSEDSSGFHIGVQAVAPGTYAGYYAVSPLTTAQLFHATIQEPVRTIPQNVFNTVLYVQSGDGSVNYVTCGAQTTAGGTAWSVWAATGDTTQATSFTQLWLDTSPNQSLTRSCTIITNGSNYLLVYLDNAQVFMSNTLSLKMASPFLAFLECQTSYAGQMLSGTFTDFYVSTTPTLTVTNLPPTASSVQLVDSLGNVISAPVSNGVAVFDIGGKTFPFSASIIVKDSSGSTIVASGTLSLVGGDTYTVVAS